MIEIKSGKAYRIRWRSKVRGSVCVTQGHALERRLMNRREFWIFSQPSNQVAAIPVDSIEDVKEVST